MASDKPKRPTPQEFLTDPKYQEEREFFSSVLDALLEKQAANKKENKEEGGLFDAFFGGK